MENYRIIITPLQYYFFGGEKHDEDLKINYYVESLNYPQQTTLLGMLRYYLLLVNNLITGKSITDKSTAKDLIGSESFKYGGNLTFKKINSLGPLYFTDGKEDYYFAPVDILFSMDKDFILKYKGKAYNVKDHQKIICPYLISNSSGEPILLSKIIEDVPQVGNQLPEKGGSKDNAFYKQNSKRLKPGWSFVIDAEIDLELKSDEYKIPFGGEKNYFSLTCEKREAAVFKYPQAHIRTPKTIVCLSDCFIENSQIKKADFGVTDSVSFRNFRSSINTKNYYALNKDADINESIVRSSRYQLLKRGSILYFSTIEKRDEVAKHINSDCATSIGFNKIITN